MSLRELSYRVFADEKFLAIEADGRRLLRLMGLSDIVRARPAAKFELLSHIPKQHRHMCLVVSENLDPWVNMRNAMYLHGRKRLFGERVHGVVFGNGHLVSDPHKLLDLIATLEAKDVRVLYWGDLDRAGLEILSRVATIANERVSVEPFAAAYRAMLKRAMGRFPDPLANEETEQGGVAISGFDLLEPALKKREAAYLAAVLEGARPSLPRTCRRVGAVPMLAGRHRMHLKRAVLAHQRATAFELVDERIGVLHRDHGVARHGRLNEHAVKRVRRRGNDPHAALHASQADHLVIRDRDA